jgi:hypothetical protein
MEQGYSQLGGVLTDQRPPASAGAGVIVVGRFNGDPTTAPGSARTPAGASCT